MEKDKYQFNFSSQHRELYSFDEREQKARKIIAVLNDHFGGNLNNLTLLDVGSSTGIMTQLLSQHFLRTVGIDIDEEAVKFAKDKFESGDSLRFYIEDSMSINLPDNSFDVINCSQVYEHVPDSKQLMREIYRLLKPGGVCYFAAGNRLVLMEAHYRLPLLSVIPKFAAHGYMKLFKKGNFYYETHLTLWGIKKLVSQFEVIDYTKNIIRDPAKYYATDVIEPGSMKQKFASLFLDILYFLSTDYVFLLRKKS